MISIIITNIINIFINIIIIFIIFIKLYIINLYFCIFLGRQYGKTTTLSFLKQHLEKLGYAVFSISFEGLADSEEDKAFYEEQFNIGRSVGFDPTDTCIKLRAVINDDDVYRHRLLEFLVYVVFIDGVMSFEEKNRLSRIAERLSIPSFKLERYIRQNKAISEFENFISTLGTRVKYEESKVCSNMEYNRGYVPHDEVTNSLEVFGLNKKSDFADVHSAYIKLMKKYHPDRLKARGISSDMVKVYVEKTKTIQRAYDILKKHFDVKR